MRKWLDNNLFYFSMFFHLVVQSSASQILRLLQHHCAISGWVGLAISRWSEIQREHLTEVKRGWEFPSWDSIPPVFFWTLSWVCAVLRSCSKSTSLTELRKPTTFHIRSLAEVRSGQDRWSEVQTWLKLACSHHEVLGCAESRIEV